MSKNTDHYTDLEYIREKFRSDGIKAPDSLSEENIFAMLPDLDEVQKQTDSDGQPHDAGKSKDPSDAFTQVKAKKRPAVRKWMAVAACTLIALLGVSQVYNAVTAPPDTSLVNGELYTFKNKTEIDRLVDSLSSENNYNLWDGGDILYEDSEMATGETSDTAAPSEMADGSNGLVRSQAKSSSATGSSEDHSDSSERRRYDTSSEAIR